MSDMTIKDLAKAMGNIDFAMLTTRTDGGQLATRPMSNNGDVEYDGDSYYFSWESARTVSDILADPQVALSFQGSAGLLGKPPLFVAVEGTAVAPWTDQELCCGLTIMATSLRDIGTVRPCRSHSN